MYNPAENAAQLATYAPQYNLAMPNMSNMTNGTNPHQVNLFWIHWDYSAVIIFKQWTTLDIEEDRTKFIIANVGVFVQAVIFMLLPAFKKKVCDFLAGCEEVPVN